MNTPYGTASKYPLASALLSIPIYAAPVLFQEWWKPLTIDGWRDLAVGKLQKVAAAIFAALSVAVFWSICVALGFRFTLAVVLTILYAFGSETFAVSSQGLWQHGPGSLALLSAIRALLALETRPRTGTLLVGVFFGLAIAIRINNLLLVGPIGLAALYRHPRLWLLQMLPALVIVGSVGAYNYIILGSILGGYQGQLSSFGLAHLESGLLGSFFSPARGLFLYFPAALLALVLVVFRPSTLSRNGLFLALGVGVLLTTALNASYFMWHGGWCFGPRYFTEVQGPILIILGGSLETGGQRLFVAAICLALIVPYSILIQFMGTFSEATIAWNGSPINIDERTSRLWDWDDNPIFRGLRAKFD